MTESNGERLQEIHDREHADFRKHCEIGNREMGVLVTKVNFLVWGVCLLLIEGLGFVIWILKEKLG
jgi:hypothetical protein